MKNLQISYQDIIGNKFNGHNLHLYLREKGIDSKQIVLIKDSEDKNTKQYNFLELGTKNFLLYSDFFNNDIIHFHLIHQILDVNYIPIISRMIPTVITLHDPYFLSGHCIHHFDCDNWKNHCRDCPYLDVPFPIPNDYTALNFQLTKNAIQESKISVIVSSRWLEKKVKKSPIWKNKKIYFLPFGADQEIFKPADRIKVRNSLGISQDTIVVMARINESVYKGIDIIKATLDSLKGKKVTILTVDAKNLLNDYRDEFEIHDYGWVTDDKFLAKLYQASDIFLMPSWQDSFGMMAIEAMSCGTMVLALKSDGSAVPDIINAPICGLSASKRDYARILLRLISQKEEIYERGKKSYAFAKRHYSKDKYVEGMIKIYKEIIYNHVIDNEASLVLQQLRKHMYQNHLPNTSSAQEIEITKNHFKIFSEGSFLRDLYRRILPLKLRKRVFGFLGKIANFRKEGNVKK